MAIKNIIFDLGNVILDLNYSNTEQSFRQLLQEDFDQAYIKYEADRLFERLEIGVISPLEFVRGMKAATEVPLSDDEIIDSWNALLAGIPGERLHWLKELGQDYQLFLLSNTNAIHINWLNEYLQEHHEQSIHDFNDLFVKHYFSFQLKMRKPEAQIFEHILQDAAINAQETLFIDDLRTNVEAAAKLGLQVHQHPVGTEIKDSLPKLLSQQSVE